jgi:hypothetical protein
MFWKIGITIAVAVVLLMAFWEKIKDVWHNIFFRS